MRGRSICQGVMFVVLVCGRAMAEEDVVDTPQSLNRTETWPTGDVVPEGNKLYLVTLAEPKRRQTCAVKSLTSDEIVCKRHGGKVAIYRRSELEAVVRAGASRAVQHIFQVLAVVGGVAIWAGHFVGPVSPVGGIALRVVGGLLVFVSLESLAWDNDDYSDRSLYLKPGETLPFPLRN